MTRKKDGDWKPTACCLCLANCGILVQLGGDDGRSIVRIRGDKKHPVSRGYTCNKVLQLDYYQNNKQRLNSPLRRNADGLFEKVDWDTAIREIAEKYMSIRDTHGGDKIMYYGGGGQGNHLGGAYSGSVQKALGIRYRSNALAQEKTGLAWVSNRVLGGFWHADLEHCDVAVIIGKNPWQSNGIQRARIVMRDISKNPDRTLIVLDPQRTETAELADIHLAVRPGRDVWCISAILGHMVQNNLVNIDWLEANTSGHEAVLKQLAQVPVEQYAEFSGVPFEKIVQTAEAIGNAQGVGVYEDLGTEMAPHSTLCSYLNMLIFLLPGSLGKKGGTNMITGLNSLFSSVLGHIGGDGYEVNYPTSPVTGSRIVSNLVPCNMIPEEILTDHPDRFRAMLVESANPAHSLADSSRFRDAFEALEFLVVIDVVMTETAELADYVLPAPSQYEKYEATFFNFEYPVNTYHLRHPLMEPMPGTLPEPEIHARLVEAMGIFEEGELAELQRVAQDSRDQFAERFFAESSSNPKLLAYIPYVLYRTLGPALPKGADSAAALWGLCQMFAQTHPAHVRNAGYGGQGFAAGEQLFTAILEGKSGTIISREEFGDPAYQFPKEDGKVALQMKEMNDELATLADYEMPPLPDDFPLILAAGERRSYTANTIIRNPDWLKSNNPTALCINPVDAGRIGLTDNATALLTTKRGSVEVIVEVSDRMQAGTIALPNGLGLSYPDADGNRTVTGASPNELTALEDRDPWVGTPWHKYVPARLEAL
ncbi:MAG: molybdopterin-dependent oxidoreductase [Gammaproteobacteria bacterium]|nr:molybdopterin-dependent oxidoreductase [Gammaproteobacteria bacterium]